MKAVLIKEFGDADQMYIGEWEKPVVGENELLVKVGATALNRADTLQRKGLYPPPVGASPILGLEMAGEVVEKDLLKYRLVLRLRGLSKKRLPWSLLYLTSNPLLSWH